MSDGILEERHRTHWQKPEVTSQKAFAAFRLALHRRMSRVLIAHFSGFTKSLRAKVMMTERAQVLVSKDRWEAI